jgi:hypothetical protein
LTTAGGTVSSTSRGLAAQRHPAVADARACALFGSCEARALIVGRVHSLATPDPRPNPPRPELSIRPLAVWTHALRRSRTSGNAASYGELCDILADPSHPDHAERVEWLGHPYDPAAFDKDAVNAALTRIRLG